MSESINSIREQLWSKMRKKKYRDNFVAAHLSTNIAAQIQTLRESRKWTQKELADKAGMSQARISVMENPAYDKYTLSTLRRIASTFDVAIIAKFAPFSELVDWVAELAPEKLQVAGFENDALKEPEPVTFGKRPAPDLNFLAGREFGTLQQGWNPHPAEPYLVRDQSRSYGLLPSMAEQA